MTRSYDELTVEAYKYVMSTLLRLKDNHHLLKALERGGYKDDIGAVLALSEDDLDNLDFEDSNGNVVLCHAQRSQPDQDSRCLQPYRWSSRANPSYWKIGQRLTSRSMTTSAPMIIRRSSLASFPCQHNPPPTLNTTATVSPRRTPADEFRRTIKRDPSLFPKLTDWKQWDNYHRKIFAQARSQAVENINFGTGFNVRDSDSGLNPDVRLVSSRLKQRGDPSAGAIHPAEASLLSLVTIV